MLLFLIIIFLILICIFLAYNVSNRFDHIMRFRASMQLLLLTFFVVIVFALLAFVYVFFANKNGGDGDITSFLRLFGLFSQSVNADTTKDTPTYLFQMIVSITGAVCFGGMLISTITNIFQRRVDSYAKGKVRYGLLSGHDIIIGANELLEPALRHLKYNLDGNPKRQIRKVLVVTAKDAEQVREQICHFGVVDDKNIIIYNGNIFNSDLISQLHLSKCRQAVIIGDDTVSSCDIGNTNIAGLLYSHFHPDVSKESLEEEPTGVDDEKRTLTVYVSLFDDSYFLNFYEKKKTSKIYFYPFNYYELCVSRVWGYYHFFKMLNAPKEEKGSVSAGTYNYPDLSYGSSNGALRLFILGFNAMGQEVLKSAIKWAHFSKSDEFVTQIYVFTKSQEAVNKFKRCYPYIDKNIHDIIINFYVSSPYSDTTINCIKDVIKNKDVKPYIVICSDNNADNFTLATHLPSGVYKKNVPVLVQFDEANETILYDLPRINVRFRNVHFFGFHNNDIPFFSGLTLAQKLCYLHAKRKNGNLKGDERKRWERFPFDNSKKVHLCHVNGLYVLFKELGLYIVDKDESAIGFPKREAMNLLQKQFIGCNTLNGYSITEKPDSANDWNNRCTNMLFSYDELEQNGGEAYLKRKESMENYLNDIMEWLQENNKSLKKISS